MYYYRIIICGSWCSYRAFKPLPHLALCSMYANLYVHLLQRQGDADKLLQLLQGMKKR